MKAEKYVSINVDNKGEITAQIRFTSDEIEHLLWSGADWYEAGDAQKRLDLESSITRKIGAASDLMDGVSYGDGKAEGDGDHGVNLLNLMDDNQLIGSAYELSKLLQHGCEHYDMEPTTENMAWMQENITTSAPLNRASALEYAARLIDGAAGDLYGEPEFPF